MNIAPIFYDSALQINTVQDGDEAIARYLKISPQILIINVQLGKTSGLDVINYIRNQALDTDIYILALGTENDLPQKIEALNLGANDFLLTPFVQEELTAKLNVAKRQLILNNQLHKAYERIAREIDTVASLQNKLLPKEEMSEDKIMVRSFYIPSGKASGDYYDFFPLQDDIIRVVIADVSGHGSRAAFLMAVVRSIVRSSEYHPFALEEIFTLVNNQLCDIIGDERDFVTIFAADIDLKRKTLRYINAGHCPGLLGNTRTGKTEPLETTTTILGFFPIDFSAQELDISEDNALFLFTDGYYEWDVNPGEMLGLEHFLDVSSSLFSKDNFFLESLEEKLTAQLEIKPSFPDDRSALWVRWKYEDPKNFQGPSNQSGC